MKMNQQGFTYPLTLCLLILFLLFFSSSIDRLLAERKLLHETMLIQQQDYYFLSSIKKIETLLETSDSIPGTATFHYEDGLMLYTADAPQGSQQKVSFTLRLSSGTTVTAGAVFDTTTKKIVAWTQ
ncbi:competence type IV pilus minor pilin ComGG [Bacillus rubiinfantis]|uniref:competence type IV pilus minor pilin ComGG n=1 Tax=Bacillus rubiinfantis TaxID=1499680 RepID=UPI0006950C60|nr:competence type IV pilus minor pilin ComGG [Bacillus rubiinfantis]